MHTQALMANAILLDLLPVKLTTGCLLTQAMERLNPLQRCSTTRACLEHPGEAVRCARLLLVHALHDLQVDEVRVKVLVIREGAKNIHTFSQSLPKFSKSCLAASISASRSVNPSGVFKCS